VLVVWTPWISREQLNESRSGPPAPCAGTASLCVRVGQTRPRKEGLVADDASPKIGFRNPPLSTRFRKGQSGNPRGRPKGAKGFRTDFVEELREVIQVGEGNSARTVTKQRALVKALVDRALQGDLRALEHVLDLGQRFEAASEAERGNRAGSDHAFESFLEGELSRREADKRRKSR
jgi:hypothetical protein